MGPPRDEVIRHSGQHHSEAVAEHARPRATPRNGLPLQSGATAIPQRTAQALRCDGARQRVCEANVVLGGITEFGCPITCEHHSRAHPTGRPPATARAIGDRPPWTPPVLRQNLLSARDLVNSRDYGTWSSVPGHRGGEWIFLPRAPHTFGLACRRREPEPTNHGTLGLAHLGWVGD
jgi:hypothetical protein